MALPARRRGIMLLFVSLVTLVFLLAGPSAAPAQSGSAQALFAQGLAAWRSGDYTSAHARLLGALDKSSSAPHLSKIWLLLSAVSDRLGDPSQSRYYAAKLVRQFPQSRYREAAEFALARASYNAGETVEALFHLLIIIDRNPATALAESARMTGSRIAAQGVHAAGLEGYLAEFQRAGSRNWLLYWLARQAYGQGRRSEGETWLNRLEMNAPEARLQRLAQELRARPAAESLYRLRVGIILPLSGFEAENGMEFLRGVALAFQDQPQGIELIVKDSGSSIRQGIRVMQEMIDSRVDLVLGDLAGDRSAAMAALAAERNIPMLVPVASDNGIAALGPGVWQLTSDLETRGAALARYAYSTLGLRTFVSLAPADEYGQALSDAFANAVDKLGGTIIAQQWYYPGTQDVSRQFTAIRESAGQYTPRDSVSTSDFLSGAYQEQDKTHDFKYSRPGRRPVLPPADGEEQDIPLVTSIDGLFMPVYAEDLSIVAPQFSLAHIQAVPLGGDDWLHGTLLQSQRRYLDGAVFCAGSQADETSTEYIQFKNRFRMATATSAGPLAVSGYDAARLVTAAVAAGNRSAGDILNWIGQAQHRSGIGGSFSFSRGSRVNQEVAILRYKNGVITRLHD